MRTLQEGPSSHWEHEDLGQEADTEVVWPRRVPGYSSKPWCPANLARLWTLANIIQNIFSSEFYMTLTFFSLSLGYRKRCRVKM